VTGAETKPALRFTLELPPDSAYVSAARLFAATVAREVGVAEELLDDIKVAVGEASARALATAPDRPLSVVAEGRDDRLTFAVAQGEPPTVSGGDLTSTPTPQELAAGLNLELITALFEDADVFQGDDGGAVVRFSVPSSRG
jgi:anti-sigma regulatory factor (Ser/Thr protein kinase)